MIPVFLSGMGWVTPLGRDLETVWAAIQAQIPPAPSLLQASHHAPAEIWQVPADTVKDTAGLPRLRRSSVISHYAVAAAADAARHAGWDSSQAERTALVFASSDGGVVYTRKFYGDLIEKDDGPGSPLLFPETVYNAPASHIAAHLGLTSTALTLVGDSAVALAALHTAWQLIALDEVDHCLVVTSQELDGITCEAYGRSRVLLPQGRFSDGAAALMLSREPGSLRLAQIHPGASYRTQADAATALEEILRCEDHQPHLVVASGTGNRFQDLEEAALAHTWPEAEILRPKHVLGESLCSSALQQVITAALALRPRPGQNALVPVIGFNGLMASLVLTAGSSRA